MLEEIGMIPGEVAAVVMRYPLLLTVAAEDARAATRWLKGRAGLSAKQVSVMEGAGGGDGGGIKSNHSYSNRKIDIHVELLSYGNISNRRMGGGCS